MNDPNVHLIEIVHILLTAGTGDNNGHMHGTIDQRSRIKLEEILSTLELEQLLKSYD